MRHSVPFDPDVDGIYECPCCDNVTVRVEAGLARAHFTADTAQDISIEMVLVPGCEPVKIN